jgi:O-antigen/teichoic acid export membrane protein
MKATLKALSREANVLSLAGNIAVSFFGFVGFALLARQFPMEEFGEWVLYISSAAFVDMFRFGIVTTAVIRYLSGADAEDRPRFIGSFIFMVFLATAGISAIIWFCHFTFPGPIRQAGYELFFTWYPFIAFVSIPMNTALVIMQADLRFDRILMINGLYSAAFFGFILAGFFFFKMTLVEIIWGQFFIYSVLSLLCMALGWAGTRHLFRASRRTNRVLFDFGKYTTLTLIGTNLLRSADALIISLSPMGTTAVALYSIPMKITELQQIPLRSFAATAFPKMSKASIQGRLSDVKATFYTYSGAMTYLFAFISLLIFVFADFLVLVLGGAQYLGTDPVTGANTALIVRIFSIYGLLLPFERMTGIGLDSVNRPDLNFRKVLFMVIANVAGDLIAVFLFKSLAAVAVGSVIFTLFGVWLGYYFLDRELGIERRKVFSSGLNFYKLAYCKVRNLARQYQHS